jgi:sugar phosphate isomerase/epimerase
MSCLIGYSGFIGSSLLLENDFDYMYNSTNIQNIKNNTYNTIICCGASAKKWWANQNGIEDKKNIDILINNLETIKDKCKKFILVSTIDVYHDFNHPYGCNRHYLEDYVKVTFKDYHIIRLPALFGYGLKKNMLYDLLKNKIDKINLKSKFQWYYIHDLSKDIIHIIKNNISDINLFSEPVFTQDIFDIVSKYKDLSHITIDNTNPISYDYKIDDRYWQSRDTILSKMSIYIQNMLNSKLGISSLSHNNFKNIYDELKHDFGISYQEIAPLSYFGTDFINRDLDFFDQYKNNNIYSMQSILYPLSWNLFVTEDREKLLTYLLKLIDISSYLNIKYLVFGSPKNRKILDSTIDPNKIAFDFFSILDKYANKKQVNILLEPNSSYYGCNFLTNVKETYDFIQNSKFTNIKLMLDVGNTELEQQDPMKILDTYVNHIYHIHLSNKDLKILNNAQNINKLYSKYRDHNFMFTIEILNVSKLDLLRSIYQVYNL